MPSHPTQSVFALLFVVAACGPDPDRCRIENVVAKQVDVAGYRDCGFLESPFQMHNAVEPTWRAAHDCVRASIAAREPFLMIWERQGIDSYLARAYSGREVNGEWVLSRFEHETFSLQFTRHSSCEQLEIIEPCPSNTLFDNLCFTCRGELIVEDCRSE